MANIDLTPATLNVSMVQTKAQSFQTAAIKNFAGTNVDFSTWDSLTASAIPAAPNPTSASATFGTVTGTNGGIIKLHVSDTDLASVAPGTCRLAIYGVPVAGDDPQLVASGVLTVNGA